MRIFALALMLGGTACRTDCSPNAPGRVDIGTGETGFIPLDPTDPTFELVHGPQGGWHVLIGLDAAGLNATDIVVAQIVGSFGDDVVAKNESAWLGFVCNSETETLQVSNTFLIFDDKRFDSPCPLHDQMLTVEVTLPDSDGNDIVGTTTARVDDPRHDECEE